MAQRSLKSHQRLDTSTIVDNFAVRSGQLDLESLIVTLIGQSFPVSPRHSVTGSTPNPTMMIDYLCSECKDALPPGGSSCGTDTQLKL